MRRGVTLLEVLVAAVLMAIGLLGALEVVARGASASRAVTERTRALMFARSKLEEILKEPVLQVGTDQGQGVDASVDFDWEAAIEPSEHPSLVVITVQARSRVTGVSAAISALRRPELQPPPTDSEAASGGGAGSPSGGGRL